jgi:methionyl-tRNA formyltransferase
VKVVYFGTPEFAIDPLIALVRASDVEVTLVVSQPDRKSGRGGRFKSPAVVDEATRMGIPVLQPEVIRGNSEFAERLSLESAGVFAVAAYGRILPRQILDLPRLGCVNVHASLLPRFRGASPIAAALLAGDRETGISIMQMTEGLDEGPILAARRVAIESDEDAGALSQRLSALGAGLLVETLRRRDEGTVTARPQEGEPTYCRPISRADGRIDWNLTADEISRRRRAYSPWPGIFTFLGSERIKVLAARTAAGISGASPGEIRAGGSQGPVVACGGGTALWLETVQREGRRPVSGTEFLGGLARTTIRLE